MMTHERNVLVWLVAEPRRTATLLGLVLAAAFCLGCTGGLSPTAPEHMTEPELRMLGYLQCWAEAKGLEGTVRLVLFDEQRVTREGGTVICAAWPQDGKRTGEVECWRPWINGETQYASGPTEMLWAAGHEVCHMSGIWDEGLADACNQELQRSGVCGV